LSIKPELYSENEAWILFQLNDRPVETSADGDFNVLAIMDVSTSLIHGMEFIPTSVEDLSEFEAKKLLHSAETQGGAKPNYLFVDSTQKHDRVKRAAAALGIKTVPKEGKSLDVITEEARVGFSARFTMGSR
jgi:hypothetical protein